MNIIESLNAIFSFAFLTIITISDVFTRIKIPKPSNQIQSLEHNETKSFLEPLIEFNQTNYTFSQEGSSCTLVHPKTKKQLQIENRKTGKFYLLDKINHTISEKNFYGDSLREKCQIGIELTTRENAGTFIKETAYVLCVLGYCNEKEQENEKVLECISELMKKKRETKSKLETIPKESHE